ncbi:hypothetical protein NDU88_003580 [Pleurodeles waltl]|uniref:Uncharacterized protein n=1 Tax=Pleurodeles waltl TaxID=8319 RepID=A0AAV7NH24_PLEWA|nr:hypothetical protein NDU88_003580 [Pleurodeles waltl]
MPRHGATLGWWHSDGIRAPSAASSVRTVVGRSEVSAQDLFPAPVHGARSRSEAVKEAQCGSTVCGHVGLHSSCQRTYLGCLRHPRVCLQAPPPAFTGERSGPAFMRPESVMMLLSHAREEEQKAAGCGP